MTANTSTDDSCRIEYSPDGETTRMAVARALVEVLEANPLDLPPLDDALSSDTLAALEDPDDEVAFSYRGVRVTVRQDGRVLIRQRESTGQTA